MSTPRLHPADLERLAALVADHLADRLEQPAAARPAPAMLTAAQVAERFGITPEWVRDHADELGAVRLGDGPRPRLRFDVAEVAAALTAHERRKGSQAADRPRPRRKSPDHRQVTASGCPLLPIASPEA